MKFRMRDKNGSDSDSNTPVLHRTPLALDRLQNSQYYPLVPLKDPATEGEQNQETDVIARTLVSLSMINLLHASILDWLQVPSPRY